MLPRRLRLAFATLVVIELAALAPSSAVPAHQGGAGRGDPSEDVVTSIAKCPHGETAIGGGFRGPKRVTIIANQLHGTRGWLVTSTDAEFPAAAYVVCGDIEPTTVDATAAFPGDPGDQLVLAARCPSGQRPVSGGWEFVNDDTENSSAFSSRPTRRGWKLKAFADSGSANSLTVYANCADVRTAVRTGSRRLAQGDNTFGAKASCPAGQRVVGGGYSTSPKSDFYNSDGPDLFYYASQPFGSQQWQVRTHEFSRYPGQVRTTAYAICVESDSL